MREKKEKVWYSSIRNKNLEITLFRGGKTRCRIHPFYEGGRMGIEIRMSVCLHMYKETLKGTHKMIPLTHCWRRLSYTKEPGKQSAKLQ